MPPRAVVPKGATAVQRAEFHYRQAIERQRLGDWAGYGEEIRALGTALEELRKAEQPRR